MARMRRWPVRIALGLVAGCFSESDGDGSGGETGTASQPTSGTDPATATAASESSGTTASSTGLADTGSSGGTDPDTTGDPCRGLCLGDVGRVLTLPLMVDVAAVGDGDLVVLGGFDGEISVLGQSFLNPSGSDLLVARMTSMGELVWAQQWPGEGATYPRSLAASGTERVAIAVAYDGPLSSPAAALPTPVGGETWVGVGVHDLDGTLLQAEVVQGSTLPFGGVDIDTSSRVIVSASFAGAIIVPGQGILTSAGGNDGALWRFQVGSESEYAVTIGSTGPDQIAGVVYGGLELGPARVVGEFSGTVATNGGTLTSAGATDAFVVGVDGSGASTWARRIGGAGPDLARGVAVDAIGDVYVFGHHGDGLQPEPGEGEAVAGAGSSDLALTKYAVDGEFVWRRVWGGPGEEQAREVTVADGVVVAVGELRGSTDFDGTVLSAPAGSTDALVIAVDADDGALRWARAFGGNNDDRALAATVTSEGAWVSLVIFGEVDVDGGTAGVPGMYTTALSLIGL